MNANRNVQYHIDLSTMFTIQNKTAQGVTKDCTQTGRRQLNLVNHVAGAVGQATLVVDLLAMRMTQNGDNGHHISSREYETFRRDENRIFIRYRETSKYFRRDEEMTPAPERVIIVKRTYEEADKTTHGDSNNTLS